MAKKKDTNLLLLVGLGAAVLYFATRKQGELWTGASGATYQASSLEELKTTNPTGWADVTKAIRQKHRAM